MDLSGKELWQVGTGDTERSYGHICTRFDVMLLGPGHPEVFDENIYKEKVKKSQLQSLNRFYKSAKQGDIVLLRFGTRHVLAVGEIADESPQWLNTFSDVDGWDLQHVRRVRWYPETKKDFPKTTFGGQGKPFAQVRVAEVRSWLQTLIISESDRSRELALLPNSGISLEVTELARRLTHQGFPSNQIEKLSTTLTALQEIAQWYRNESKLSNGRPSEQETVAYLVIPLLFSLGWTEQTAAIEWKNVDVALFHAMPSNDQSLACVIEAKLLGRSVFSPLGQASNYALQNGRENCNRLIVTNGVQYALYGRIDDQFYLSSYLNIMNLRDTYPIYQCEGAVQTLLGMARSSMVISTS